jgi:hypothetical protein
LDANEVKEEPSENIMKRVMSSEASSLKQMKKEKEQLIM